MAGGSYARQVADVLMLRSSAPGSPRHQEVVNSAWSARLCWLALHSAAIGVLCVVDSDLSRAWRDGNYKFLAGYLALLSATVFSYFYVCGSSPGYVDEVMKEVQNWGPPEEFPPGTPGRSPAALLQGSGSSNSFNDLRSPTRHASFLNLKDMPSSFDAPSLGVMSPQYKKPASKAERKQDVEKEVARESSQPPGEDSVSQLLCKGACSTSQKGDLEQGPSGLSDRALGFKKPEQGASRFYERALGFKESEGGPPRAPVGRPGLDLPGGSDAGERSPLLTKSRSTGRLEDARSLSRSPTGKSPSMRRFNSGKRCTYCQLWQPLRTKHCHECDRCVLRFDHHCFWVGTCVGYRNHRRFWWYLFFESCLGLWTVILNFSAFDWNDRSEGWFSLNVLIVLDSITLICFLIFLIALLIFHGYLAATDQTTYETTRRKRIAYLRPVPDNISPFSKGCTANLYNFCCMSTANVPVYELPSLDELQARSTASSWIDNEYYSCC